MTRTTLLSIAFALFVLAAGAAHAAPLDGDGILEAKDVGKALVVIEGETYAVSPTATIRWKDGKSTTLSALPAPEIDEPPGLFPLLRATFHGNTTPAGLAVLDRIVVAPAKE